LEKYPESITDAWGVVIRYEYTKKLLTKIQWDTGQEIRIVYDKKDRVVELQGPGTERRGFQWSNTVYNSMVDQVGYSVSWKITPNAIDTADSWGHTVHTEYAFGMISAWTDPRGIQSTVSKKDNVLYVNYAGIRNWAIALQDKRVLSIEQPGFGAWKWKYDKQDRIVELAEAQNIRTSSIQYPTPQKQRVQKQGGWLDIQYDRPYTENGFAKILSISDISGTLVSIQRNAQGQAKKIEDALGGEIHIDRDMTGYPTTVVFRNGQSWQLEYDVFHRIRTIISPQQDTWQIQRDHLGRITKIFGAKKSTCGMRMEGSCK
jgi:YD repeat-containing protein